MHTVEKALWIIFRYMACTVYYTQILKMRATLVLEINSLLNSSCIHVAAVLRGEHSMQLHTYDGWLSYRCRLPQHYVWDLIN